MGRIQALWSAASLKRRPVPTDTDDLERVVAMAADVAVARELKSLQDELSSARRERLAASAVPPRGPKALGSGRNHLRADITSADIALMVCFLVKPISLQRNAI
jgi:hypothetical protein